MSRTTNLTFDLPRGMAGRDCNRTYQQDLTRWPLTFKGRRLGTEGFANNVDRLPTAVKSTNMNQNGGILLQVLIQTLHPLVKKLYRATLNPRPLLILNPLNHPVPAFL